MNNENFFFVQLKKKQLIWKNVKKNKFSMHTNWNKSPNQAFSFADKKREKKRNEIFREASSTRASSPEASYVI